MIIAYLESESVGSDIDVTCFEQFGEVRYYRTTGKDTVAERIKDADIVIANKAPLGREALSGASHLKMIAELATGYDNIDTEYCRERGIAVSNVRGYSTDSVAQHTVALALGILERLGRYDSFVKSGGYAATDRFSVFDYGFTELAGKTWGIVGMGAIGQRVAKVASALGANVIFASLTGKSKVTEYEKVSFEDLLARSDVLSLHCPLTEDTFHLMNEKTLSKMKKTAVLINTARGKVVDTKALADALAKGTIGGAGLDVFETEPIDKNDPLLALPSDVHLLMTPHMAWASVEARERVVKETFENISAFIEGKERMRVV